MRTKNWIQKKKLQLGQNRIWKSDSKHKNPTIWTKKKNPRGWTPKVGKNMKKERETGKERERELKKSTINNIEQENPTISKKEKNF